MKKFIGNRLINPLLLSRARARAPSDTALRFPWETELADGVVNAGVLIAWLRACGACVTAINAHTSAGYLGIYRKFKQPSRYLRSRQSRSRLFHPRGSRAGYARAVRSLVRENEAITSETRSRSVVLRSGSSARERSSARNRERRRANSFHTRTYLHTHTHTDTHAHARAHVRRPNAATYLYIRLVEHSHDIR